MFFDTHTHLGNRQFDADLPTVLERARAAGVSRMVAPAVDLENARKLLAIAEGQPIVYLSGVIYQSFGTASAEDVVLAGTIDFQSY